MGTTDYQDLATGTVLIKIETGDPDYFVGFNRQTSFNSGTQEGGDKVLIVIQGREGMLPERSTLVAKLLGGQSYQLGSFGVISVSSINTAASPGYAYVTISKACQSDNDCWGGNNDCPASYCDVNTNTCERALIGNVFGCNCNGVCSDSPSRSTFINCGGPSFEDPAGNLWEPDDIYVNTGLTDSTGVDIAGTDIEMFQTDRYDDTHDSTEMEYTIPLEDGLYDVHLYFR